VYKDIYLDLLDDSQKKMMEIVNKHLQVVLKHWINNFKGSGLNTP